MGKPEVLSRTKFYELHEPMPYDEREAMGVHHGWFPEDAEGNRVYALWDGNPPRAPREGEWYLSGSSIGAWRAHNDLPASYHMANLVTAKKASKVANQPQRLVKVADLPKLPLKGTIPMFPEEG